MTAELNPWRDAILNRLAINCLEAEQDEPPESILRRIISSEVGIALDPNLSFAAQALVERGEALARDG